jgi:hypothetical protein
MTDLAQVRVHTLLAHVNPCPSLMRVKCSIFNLNFNVKHGIIEDSIVYQLGFCIKIRMKRT